MMFATGEPRHWDDERNNGALGENRTRDLRITSALLYRLSYQGGACRKPGRKYLVNDLLRVILGGDRPPVGQLRHFGREIDLDLQIRAR
jgi:hypothetical protein